MHRLSFTFLALSGVQLACGGSTPPPAPQSPESFEIGAAPSAEASAPPPSQPALSCEDALAQKSPVAPSLCRERCDAGDAGICLKIADLHAAGAADRAPDIAAAAEHFERACETGSDEACFRGSAALRATDRGRADRLLENGCRERPESEFAQKSCYALGEARASSQKLEDLEASLAWFERACRKGHTPSCDEKDRVHKAIKIATEPEVFEGKLVSKTGNKLRMKLDGGGAPSAGASAQVQRYFESKPGDPSPLGVFGGLLGATISGWVIVAEAAVDKVENGVATLTIVEEKSQMTINGRKVNHFSAGARIKLAVPRGKAP